MKGNEGTDSIALEQELISDFQTKSRKLNWLLKQGCKVYKAEYSYKEFSDIVYPVYTKHGDFITLADFYEGDKILKLIYRHRLVFLMSTHTARNDGQKGCTVGVGFNETEQRWYGWTHRAYHSYGVGDKIGENSCLLNYGFKAGQELKTLDECKECAICTSEYFN